VISLKLGPFYYRQKDLTAYIGEQVGLSTYSTKLNLYASIDNVTRDMKCNVQPLLRVS